MAHFRNQSGGNTAQFLTSMGNRARRADENFRPFFEDRTPGNGPQKPNQPRQAAKRFVAKPAIPTQGGVLLAPENEPGWTWDAKKPATGASAVKTNNQRSFAQRFPKAQDAADARLKAEAPSTNAEHYMDANAGAATSPKSTRANVASPVRVSHPDKGAAADTLLHQSRRPASISDPVEQVDLSEPVEQSLAAGAPAVGDLSQSALAPQMDQGVESRADDGTITGQHQAQQPTHESRVVGAKPAPTTASSLTAIAGRQRRMVVDITAGLVGTLRTSALPLARKGIDTGYAGARSLAHSSRKLFSGSSMKKDELPDNSLLELDANVNSAAATQPGSDVSKSDLRELKRQSAPSQAAANNPNSNDDNGIVGAVKLAPNSPLPRNEKDRAVIQNPVVHGGEGAASEYKVSVTHAAPKTETTAKPGRLKANQRSNTFGLLIGGALALVVTVLAALLIWLAFQAFTGNVSTPGPEVIADPALDPLTPVAPVAQVPAPAPPVSAAVGMTPAEVQEAEDLLAQLGILNDAQVDGFADEGTRQAVQQFETIMGYPGTDGTMTKFLQGEIRGIAFERGLFPR